MMREDSFRTEDGYRIAYRVFGEGRRTLICVHGLYRNGHDFDYLAAGLADAMRVVTPDIIGRGDSDYARDPSRYNTEHYIKDVRALAAHLGADRYDFLGTSMGGMVGMAMAAAPDTGVEHLVLNDVGPEIALATLKEIGQRSLRAPDDFASFADGREYLRRALESWGELNQEQVDHVARYGLRQQGARWVFSYDRELIHGFRWPPGDVDLWPLYRAFKGPVLVLHGSDSEVLTADTAARLRGEPNTQVVDIPGTGHAPHLMSAEQIGLVRRFLLG